MPWSTRLPLRPSFLPFALIVMALPNACCVYFITLMWRRRCENDTCKYHHLNSHFGSSKRHQKSTICATWTATERAETFGNNVLICKVKYVWTFSNHSSWTMHSLTSVTRLGDFCTLGNFLKPLATINLPKSLTFLGNICKGVKIYHFSSEIILVNFYIHLAIFSCHTDNDRSIPSILHYTKMQ